MDGAMEKQSDNAPQELTSKMEELGDELKKMDKLFKELKQQIIDKEDKAAKEKMPQTLVEAERDGAIEKPQESTNKMEELDGKLKKMEELVKELKQLNTDKEKRPKTLIGAKEYMSEWCRAKGKEVIDDSHVECLAQAHLQNPHLDDEILKWIMWTSEMKSKETDNVRSEMQEVIRNLQICAQESFLKTLKAPKNNEIKGRAMETKKADFNSMMYIYRVCQLDMDDTNKMHIWQLYLVIDVLRSLNLDIEDVKEMWGFHLAMDFLRPLGLEMIEIPFLFEEVNTRKGPRFCIELQFEREFKHFASRTDLKKLLKSVSYYRLMEKRNLG